VVILKASASIFFAQSGTESPGLPLGLLGRDEVHKMVKSALRNPKLEFRNPKQIRNPNFQITKMHRL